MQEGDANHLASHFPNASGLVLSESSLSAAAAAPQTTNNNVQLPNPPTMQNLEDIADTIAALQHATQHAVLQQQQRENLAMWIADDECLYLKQLLSLFPVAPY